MGSVLLMKWSVFQGRELCKHSTCQLEKKVYLCAKFVGFIHLIVLAIVVAQPWQLLSVLITVIVWLEQVKSDLG